MGIVNLETVIKALIMIEKKDASAIARELLNSFYKLATKAIVNRD